MGYSGEYMASNVWRLNSELYNFLARIDPPSVMAKHQMFWVTCSERNQSEGRRDKRRAQMTWGLYSDNMHFLALEFLGKRWSSASFLGQVC